MKCNKSKAQYEYDMMNESFNSANKLIAVMSLLSGWIKDEQESINSIYLLLLDSVLSNYEVDCLLTCIKDSESKIKKYNELINELKELKEEQNDYAEIYAERFCSAINEGEY